MKRIVVLLVAALSANIMSSAQQWSGNLNTTDPITRSGYLGIGASAPVNPIQIEGGISELSLLVKNTGANGARLYLSTFSGKSSIQTDKDFTIRTNYSGWNDMVTVSHSGNMGIGVYPSSRLHVGGAVRIDGSSGGVVGTGTGSRIVFSSGSQTSIEENWGLNLIGDDAAPVKVRNAALLVGYTSSAAGYGQAGNVLVQGMVGIGTTTPVNPVQVDGAIPELNLLVRNTSENGARTYLTSFQGKSSIQTDKDFTIRNNSNGWQDRFILTYAGDVGIGTNSPDAKLAVNGQVHATEVRVTTSVPGPDYVFEDSYNLPALDEIKTYIERHKHLPEVPSAKQMEADGIKLGEMNMLLLKKVEELTLHLIQQAEMNEVLAVEVADLKKQLTELRSTIK